MEAPASLVSTTGPTRERRVSCAAQRWGLAWPRLSGSPRWLVRPHVPVAAGGAVVALLVASSVGTPPAELAAVPAAVKTAAWLHGTGPGCRVRLNDTRQYGLSPIAPTQAAQDVPAWL